MHAEYVKALVHKINHKAGREIISANTADGEKQYTLLDPHFNYSIAGGVKETLQEVNTLRYDTNWKLALIFLSIAVVMSILTYFLGFYQGSNANTTINIDPEQLHSIIQEACKIK